jgi:hypothetical protein
MGSGSLRDLYGDNHQTVGWFDDFFCFFEILPILLSAIPKLELDGASRKLRTLVIVNLSYESTNLMSGEPLCNFREAYFC